MPAVITGVGAVTAMGVGADLLHSGWSGGRCAIEDGAGRCRDFCATDHLSQADVHRTGRFVHLAVAAANEAVAQAGWDGGRAPSEPHRAACIVGTGIGGNSVMEDNMAVLLEKGPRRVNPLALPRGVFNAAAAQLAIRHGLQGETATMVAACASSAQAVGHALLLIEAGMADVVLAGGTEAPVSGLVLAALTNLGVLSRTGVCRPFDRERDGFVLGEGAGMLVLEEPEFAARRGAEPLGELLAYGATSDAFHITTPEPTATSATRAIEMALAAADVDPHELCWVNANGTSSIPGDLAETLALRQALGDAAADVPVSAPKSAIGHLLGAAGAVEAISTLLALRGRVIPPTLNLTEADEQLDLDYVPAVGRALDTNGTRVALTNSFAFGGHNAVLAIAAPS
jgi:3-oxoacyl-[acyl-carrier-protein] synthase II